MCSAHFSVGLSYGFIGVLHNEKKFLGYVNCRSLPVLGSLLLHFLGCLLLDRIPNVKIINLFIICTFFSTSGLIKIA